MQLSSQKAEPRMWPSLVLLTWGVPHVQFNALLLNLKTGRVVLKYGWDVVLQVGWEMEDRQQAMLNQREGDILHLTTGMSIAGASQLPGNFRDLGYGKRGALDTCLERRLLSMIDLRHWPQAQRVHLTLYRDFQSLCTTRQPLPCNPCILFLTSCLIPWLPNSMVCTTPDFLFWLLPNLAS